MVLQVTKTIDVVIKHQNYKDKIQNRVISLKLLNTNGLKIVDVIFT